MTSSGEHKRAIDPVSHNVLPDDAPLAAEDFNNLLMAILGSLSQLKQALQRQKRRRRKTRVKGQVFQTAIDSAEPLFGATIGRSKTSWALPGGN